MVVNELRSESVHARFLEVFGPHFAVRKVLRAKMDAVHQHPAIDIFLMKPRRQRSTPPSVAIAASGVPVSEASADASATPPVPADDSSAACGGSDAAADAFTRRPEAEAGSDGQQSADLALEREVLRDNAGAAPPDSQTESLPLQDSSLKGADHPARVKAGLQQRHNQAAPAVLGDREPCGSAKAWQMRRQGAEAARLLAGIHLPTQ